jgi:hypothetical protein
LRTSGDAVSLRRKDTVCVMSHTLKQIELLATSGETKLMDRYDLISSQSCIICPKRAYGDSPYMPPIPI